MLLRNSCESLSGPDGGRQAGEELLEVKPQLPLVSSAFLVLKSFSMIELFDLEYSSVSLCLTPEPVHLHRRAAVRWKHHWRRDVESVSGHGGEQHASDRTSA